MSSYHLVRCTLRWNADTDFSGKLELRRPVRKRQQGRREFNTDGQKGSKWRNPGAKASSRDPTSETARTASRQAKFPKTLAKSDISANSEGEDELADDEDLRIAELESKLGLDKKTSRKKVDDGLEGATTFTCLANEQIF